MVYKNFLHFKTVALKIKIYSINVTNNSFGNQIILLNSSGPALGSALFIAGGFTLPYIVVSSMAFIMAIVLAIVVPKVKTDDKNDSNNQTKSVTFSAMVKVSIVCFFYFKKLGCVKVLGSF